MQNETPPEKGPAHFSTKHLFALIVVVVVIASAPLFVHHSTKATFCNASLPITADDSGQGYSIYGDPRIKQPAHQNNKCEWVDGKGKKIDMHALGYN